MSLSIIRLTVYSKRLNCQENWRFFANRDTADELEESYQRLTRIMESMGKRSRKTGTITRTRIQAATATFMTVLTPEAHRLFSRKLGDEEQGVLNLGIEWHPGYYLVG